MDKVLNKHYGCTEKEFENFCIDYLRVKGFFCWKNAPAATYQPEKKAFIKSKRAINGIPDISFCHNGLLFFLELKKPSKYLRTQDQVEKLLSDDQKYFINNLRACGINAHVIDSFIGLKNIISSLQETKQN